MSIHEFEDNDVTRPLIGIPCLRMAQPNGTFRHAISSTYIEAVIGAGGAPLLIPSSGNEAAIYPLYRLLDGLLLTGGADINPKHYNEPVNGSEDIDDPRDITEITLTRWAIQDKMPVLGICRGHQLLNVALGGSLHQDIPSDLPEVEMNHQLSALRQQRDYIAHPVKLDPSSRLAGIIGSSAIEVNTLHHQAVKEPGKGLKVVGSAPDGVVEALEIADPDKWVFSVQCHPEELWREHAWASHLFTSFVAEAHRYRSRAQK